MFRRALFVIFVVSGCLTTIAVVLLLLLRHEPAYFRDLAQPSGNERKQRSREFFNAFTEFLQDVAEPEWEGRFTQHDINCFLDEDLSQCGAEKFLPDGVREPRVRLGQDRIRLGFRYELFPGWSSIVTIDARVWLAPKQANAVVLELIGMKAGALPISSQSLLERIADTARAQNIDVTWYRYNGHPSALMRFRLSPRMHLQSIELADGMMRFAGTTSQLSPRAKSTKQATPPVAN